MRRAVAFAASLWMLGACPGPKNGGSSGPTNKPPAFDPNPSLGPDQPENAGCDDLVLDLDEGTLNGVGPRASQALVNWHFPCRTGYTAEGVEYNYGGGVFYGDHDFYFYTHSDFLQVRGQFKGTVSPKLLGASVDKIDTFFDEAPLGDKSDSRWYFKRSYGCLTAQIRKREIVQLTLFVTSCADAKALLEETKSNVIDFN